MCLAYKVLGVASERPDAITVYLLQNGERIAEVEITEAEGWSYTFKDVEAYDEEGQAYTYTIEEEPVEGYETTIYGLGNEQNRLEFPSC